MKRPSLLLLFFIISLTAFGQKQIQRFTNAQAIDPDRYKNVQGDPMLFKEWQTGMIFDNRDSVYTNITLNYNGFEEEFEVKRDNNTFISLDSKYYTRVVVENEEGLDGKLTFEKTEDTRFKNKFLQVLHKSEKLTVYKYFETRKAEVTVQDVGKTRTFENFKQVFTYYILKDGRLKILRTKKKNLLEELGGDKKAMEGFIKDNKLKLRSDIELQQLFVFYENL